MKTLITYTQSGKAAMSLLFMLSLCQFAFAQDKHIDPSATRTLHKITFSKHVNVSNTTINEANIDAFLKFGTERLQACDARVTADQDVACQVSFERDGTVNTFGTATDGLDIIDNDAEANLVDAQPERVKFVTALMYNGRIQTGLTSTATGSIKLAEMNPTAPRTIPQYGQTFVHEFGHAQGLLYERGNTGAPPLVGNPFMAPTAGPFYEVNQDECKAYHNGRIAGTPNGPNRPVNIEFVVDDTGSMTEEIAGVRNGIILALNLFSLFTGNTCDYVFQLTTFKDNVSPRDPTTDLNVIRGQVAPLIADGGGDCPEASVEAVDAIKDRVKDGGFVFLFTDASAHPTADIAGVTAALKARGVHFFVLLSGDCTSSFSPAFTSVSQSSDGTKDTIPFSDNHDNGSASTATVIKPRSAGPVTGVPNLSPNPTAIEAYSYMAQETGGIFVFIPEVNTGSTTDRLRYENIAYNFIVGAVAPAITNIEPATGPVGGTLALTITGSNTRFNATTSLSFSDPGIVVKEVKVISPTKIEATVSIGATVPLGIKDIKSSTDLGGGVIDTTAGGRGLLQVIAAPTLPTVLSISPSSGSVGQRLTVKVTGFNTHFTNASVLNLGAGITVLNTTALSSVELQAEIQIAAAATTGFRDVRVTTGTETATENVPGPFLVTPPPTGCGLTTLTFSPDKTVNLFYPDSACTTLSVSGPDSAALAGYTYRWSTGDTTRTIKACPGVTTMYTVTVSSGTCSVTDTVMVYVDKCPRNLIVAAPSCSEKATLSWTEPENTYPASIQAPEVLDPTKGTFTYMGSLDGHGYYRSNNKYLWPVARDIANLIGGTGVNGHMATLTSAAENFFINNQIKGSGYAPWIGLYDTGRPGRFRWVTNEAFTYSNWAPGEPNNANGNSTNVAEPYVRLQDTHGDWNDQRIDYLPFIAEFEKPLIRYKQISGPKNGSERKEGVYTVCYERTNLITDIKDTCCFTITVTCKPGSLITKAASSVTEEAASLAARNARGLSIETSPNPTNHYFRLRVVSNSTERVSLQVSDVLGRIVESRSGLAPNLTMQLGSQYSAGVYVAQVIQGKRKVSVKLIKQSD